MSVNSGENKSVTLVPDDVMVTQSLDMVLFTITKCDLVNAKNPGKGIRMIVTLKRKIMSEMMTTYFPSLLLMMITYATTFFKTIFFEAALSVNLTTMLVMTTIFISKMESLPPTSVTKMIDYWLILCQLVPFAQLVLLTAMEYIRGEEDQKENQTPEKDDIQGTVQTEDNSHVELEDGIEPKEAWTITQKKLAEASPLTMLMTIGKAYKYLILNQSVLSEKKVVPMIVLFASIVYFAIAASFYFE